MTFDHRSASCCLGQLAHETMSCMVLDGIGKQGIGFARKTRRDADT